MGFLLRVVWSGLLLVTDVRSSVMERLICGVRATTTTSKQKKLTAALTSMQAATKKQPHRNSLYANCGSFQQPLKHSDGHFYAALNGDVTFTRK